MMKQNKSTGPDGFTAGFYQNHWDILKPSICAVVLKLLNDGELPEEVSKTILVLIQKVNHPQDLSHYRPISLCNVLYKIASNVISNHLKLVIPDIISAEQSAFVPGRLITDNIIAAYECLHFMKRNKAKKHQHCALKLDMMKAYDRVEWPYLKAIMLKLGFSNRWVNIVMKYRQRSCQWTQNAFSAFHCARKTSKISGAGTMRGLGYSR